MNGGAICGGYDHIERRIQFCPICKRRRRFVGTFAAYYGFTWYCVACGDRWQDDELGSRPFMRGWRKEAIAYAKALWDRVDYPASERRARFYAALDATL